MTAKKKADYTYEIEDLANREWVPYRYKDVFYVKHDAELDNYIVVDEEGDSKTLSYDELTKEGLVPIKGPLLLKDFSATVKNEEKKAIAEAKAA